MRHELYNLIAFISVLIAILIMFGLSALCLMNGRSVEAIGISGGMTGLIGVLGTFRPRADAQTKVESIDSVSIEK